MQPLPEFPRTVTYDNKIQVHVFRVRPRVRWNVDVFVGGTGERRSPYRPNRKNIKGLQGNEELDWWCAAQDELEQKFWLVDNGHMTSDARAAARDEVRGWSPNELLRPYTGPDTLPLIRQGPKTPTLTVILRKSRNSTPQVRETRQILSSHPEDVASTGPCFTPINRIPAQRPTNMKRSLDESLIDSHKPTNRQSTPDSHDSEHGNIVVRSPTTTESKHLSPEVDKVWNPLPSPASCTTLSERSTGGPCHAMNVESNMTPAAWPQLQSSEKDQTCTPTEIRNRADTYASRPDSQKDRDYSFSGNMGGFDFRDWPCQKSDSKPRHDSVMQTLAKPGSSQHNCITIEDDEDATDAKPTLPSHNYPSPSPDTTSVSRQSAEVNAVEQLELERRATRLENLLEQSKLQGELHDIRYQKELLVARQVAKHQKTTSR